VSFPQKLLYGRVEKHPAVVRAKFVTRNSRLDLAIFNPDAKNLHGATDVTILPAASRPIDLVVETLTGKAYRIPALD
jgi:hypothetical protein